MSPSMAKAVATSVRQKIGVNWKSDAFLAALDVEASRCRRAGVRASCNPCGV